MVVLLYHNYLLLINLWDNCILLMLTVMLAVQLSDLTCMLFLAGFHSISLMKEKLKDFIGRKLQLKMAN